MDVTLCVASECTGVHNHVGYTVKCLECTGLGKLEYCSESHGVNPQLAGSRVSYDRLSQCGSHGRCVGVVSTF